VLTGSRFENSTEERPRGWFGGSFLLLMVLAGVLAALIAPRGGPRGLAIEKFVDNAFVSLTAVLLIFCVALLIRTVAMYRKYGNKTSVYSSLGLTALALGMLLNHLNLENTAVTVSVYALFAASITISLRGMNASKRDIARLKAEAAEGEARGG
jgi:hypothetical protein